MEELLRLIQQDPELWDLVEKLKHNDQTPQDFLESVAHMYAIEFEEMHKISYILEVCIPCSPLSFKGVYKILAINFQSGHNMHRCLESVLLKLHFYYCLFSCTLL